MLRPRFYTRQALAGRASLILEPEPSRHIGRTLRMRPGETLCLFDGAGQEVAATITTVERDAVTVTTDALQMIERESPLHTTLAIALSRGDRMDHVIQKATELGVQHICPLTSERTVVRLDGKRLSRKREHWEKIAISACEQCGRNQLPVIADTAPFATVVAEADRNALRLLMHPSADAGALPDHCESLVLLIGPEGGFSDDEVALARGAGFQSFVLGPRILRTETAPLAALAVAQARWGDFSP